MFVSTEVSDDEVKDREKNKLKEGVRSESHHL